jgi:hypothetical protein
LRLSQGRVFWTSPRESRLAKTALFFALFTMKASWQGKDLTRNVKVGAKSWHTVFEGEEGSLETRVAAMETQLIGFAQDNAFLILTAARLQVQNIVGQFLAWMLGNQPRPVRSSTAFSEMAAAGGGNLAAACPPNISLVQFGAAADRVCDRRNGEIHYGTWLDLQQAITMATALGGRHPELRTLCREEYLILDNAGQIATAFGFS